MKTRDLQLLEAAYSSINKPEPSAEGKSPNTRETETVRYEHRVIEEHDGGERYGERIIFKVGEVLETTKSPGKRRYYGMTLGHGDGADIPASKVGVFMITRTTRVTETEERVG